MSSGQARAEEDQNDYVRLCKKMGEKPRGIGFYRYDYEHGNLLEARDLGKEEEWLKYLSYKADCKLIKAKTHPYFYPAKYTTNVRRDDFGFNLKRAALVSELAEKRRACLASEKKLLDAYDLKK